MNITRSRRVVFSRLSLLAFVVTAHMPLAAEPALPTFTAHYQVEYKGHKVGKEEMSVRFDPTTERYHFESRTEATGLLGLFRPNPSVQRTDFVLHEGAIRPLEFRVDDGTRKGEDDRRIVFDWNQRIATITSDAGASTVALTDTVLDPGTLLIAIMHDLEQGHLPGPYLYIDDDEPDTYRYQPVGTETRELAAGTFHTVMIEQRHGNSSRHMRLWLAPKLRYLPVRIVQYTDNEPRTVLTLVSIGDSGNLRSIDP